MANQVIVPTPAQTLAAAAKKYRDDKATEEDTNIKGRMNALLAKAQTIANAGGIYLQVAESLEPAVFAAVSTRSAQKVLAEKGFRVENMRGVTNIWWDDPFVTQREAEELLKPAQPLSDPTKV